MNSSIKKTLINLEALRIRLMDNLEANQTPRYFSRINTEQKPIEPLMVNGYPVFQFRYDGSMPLYDKEKAETIAVTRQYYNKATFNLYDFEKIDIRFKKGILIIQHFFNKRIITDMDNRNRKYLIDAIGQTMIIKDDDFQNLTLLEEGFLTEGQPFVNAFLLEEENLHDFLKYKDVLGNAEREDLKYPTIWAEIEREQAILLEERKLRDKEYESLF